MIIVRPTMLPISPQGMETSGSQNLNNGSFGGETNKLVNMVASTGTLSENVVNNTLIVNGDGNISVSASASVSNSSSLRLDIWLNGSRVSSTSSATSASWTGDVIKGDVLELHIWKTTTLTRSCSSASLSYTVN